MYPDEVAATAPRKRRWRRWAVILVACLATLYVAFVAALYFVQDHLIFPGRWTQGHPEANIPPLRDWDLVTLKASNGDRVAAVFARALDAKGHLRPDASARPTLLYFYGNGQSLSGALSRVNAFQRRGFNVMVPDYLGYGLSGGKPGEAGCYAAADAAYDHLLTRTDADPKHIVAVGWSLGGAVAIDLASRRPVAGLVAFSTFTSMGEMVGRAYPFVPSMLLAHKFASLEKIARVRVPILIGHGRRDEMIPVSMADRLAGAARAPVTRLNIDDAGHNDFYEVGGDAVDSAVARFVEGLP